MQQHCDLLGQREAAQRWRICEKKIFSNEAYFHLGGYVNKQTFRICGSENKHMVL